MKGLAALMRELERDAAEVPDPWATVADVITAELARREAERRLPPVPLRGLSPSAIKVIACLHMREHGRTFMARLRAHVPDDVDVLLTLAELFEHGLLGVELSVDEDGQPAEPIVWLDYLAELPEPPGPEAE